MFLYYILVLYTSVYKILKYKRVNDLRKVSVYAYQNVSYTFIYAHTHIHAYNLINWIIPIIIIIKKYINFISPFNKFSDKIFKGL